MVKLVFASVLFQAVLFYALTKNELYVSIIEKVAEPQLPYAYLSLVFSVVSMTAMFYFLLCKRLSKCMGCFEIDEALKSHSSVRE